MEIRSGEAYSALVSLCGAVFLIQILITGYQMALSPGVRGGRRVFLLGACTFLGLCFLLAGVSAAWNGLPLFWSKPGLNVMDGLLILLGGAVLRLWFLAALRFWRRRGGGSGGANTGGSADAPVPVAPQTPVLAGRDAKPMETSAG